MDNDELDEFDKLLDRASAHFNQQVSENHRLLYMEDKINITYARI